MAKKPKILTQDDLIKKLMLECPLLEEDKLKEFMKMDQEIHIRVSELISSILSYLNDMPQKYPEANETIINKCCSYLVGTFLSSPNMMPFVDMIRQDDLRIMLYSLIFKFKGDTCTKEFNKLRKKK